MYINKVSLLIITVQNVDVVVLVVKSYWVHFKVMTRNFRFGRVWYWCISIIVEVFGSWLMFMIVMKELLYCWLFLYEQCYMKFNVSNFPTCCINNSLTNLLLIPHPQQSYFRYGIEDFIGLWKDLDWYCRPVGFGRVGTGLVHSGDKRYCQSFCWQ